MRSLTLTFTAADLNKAYSAVVKKDSFLDVTENITGAAAGDKTFRSFPRIIQIVNTAGTDIELAIIGEFKDSTDQDEEAVFDEFSDNNSGGYGWVLIPEDATLSLDRVPRAKIISLRSTTGAGASASVRVDLFPMYGRKEV